MSYFDKSCFDMGCCDMGCPLDSYDMIYNRKRYRNH